MASSRQQLGAEGELAARRFLESEGYQVLDTNFRCRWGEVDIVARLGDTLVFVEVRTRRALTYGIPQESIREKKKVRLVATAETYLQSYQEQLDDWRIDLISVLVGRDGRVTEVAHLENAVELQ